MGWILIPSRHLAHSDIKLLSNVSRSSSENSEENSTLGFLKFYKRVIDSPASVIKNSQGIPSMQSLFQTNESRFWF